jgi:predicted Rossmann-fold nucleotide-binding protein
MEGVSEGFSTFEGRQGSVLGVIRSLVECAPENTIQRNYVANPVNPWVEIPLYTHLPLSSQSCLSRNHINVLTSDVVIALPGNEGTASEIELAFQYGVPLIFYTDGHPIAGRTPEEYKAGYSAANAKEAKSIAEVERLLSLHIAVQR